MPSSRTKCLYLVAVVKTSSASILALIIGSTLFHARAQAASEMCLDAFSSAAKAPATPVTAPLFPKAPLIDTDFVRAMNKRANLQLSQSPNKGPIEEFLREKGRVLSTTGTESLPNGRSIWIAKAGLGGEDSVIVKSAKGEEISIFKISDLALNGSQMIDRFTVSPDKNYVVIMTYENGSIDRYRIHMYDLKAMKMVREDLVSQQGQFSWSTGHAFYFVPDTVDRRKDYATFNLEAANPVTIRSGGFRSDGLWTTTFSANSSMFSSSEGKAVRVLGTKLKVIGDDESFLYLLDEGPKSLGAIARVPKSQMKSFATVGESRAIEAPRILPERAESLIASVEMTDKGFAILRRWGAKLSYQIINKNGVHVADIPIPESVKPESIVSLGNRRYRLSLSSAVRGKSDFVYNIAKAAWEDPNFEEKLLTVDGIRMVSEVVMVPSGDVQIPMRLVHRADLNKNGDNPVYMEAYGGFGVTFRIDGDRRPMNTEFVKRGGIVAWLAVRGGDEFGKQNWYETAVGVNKINTMNDTIACARFVAQMGWSKAEKIALSGASNGGLVTASAALLAPDAFGIVLPFAGVMDPANLTELDPDLGRGWTHDYGPSVTAFDREAIAKYSPVDLAKKLPEGAHLPYFLITAGADDGRVNALHSQRLAEILMQKAPDHVQLVTLKNSGHFVYSIDHNGWVGWRSQVVTWTTLYDYFKLKF